MPRNTRRTMFDTYLHDLGELVTGGQVMPAWTPDGSAFGFVDGPPEARVAWRVDLETGEKRPLFEIENARLAIADAIGETPAGQGVPFAEFVFSGTDEIQFQVCGSTLTLDLTTYQATKLAGPSFVEEYLGLSDRTTPREYRRTSRTIDPTPALEVPSPDGAFLLSTGDHNIVVRSTYDGRTVRLTDDGVAGHDWRFDAGPSFGQAHPTVWFGSGANWSPDSRRVVVHRVDTRGAYHAPQLHHLKSQDEVVYRYLAQAGGVMERTTLHVLDLFGRPRVELDLGDTTDTYPVAAAWLPDSSGIVVFQMSRDCKQARVSVAETLTGRVTHLFSEARESFIRIQHDVWATTAAPRVGLWLTPDGQQIIWESDRSGWRHLYVYDLEGSLLRQLTDGEWPVQDVVAIREGHLYFTGHRDQRRPYDLHFYRVPLEGGEVEALTEAPGVHSVTLAPSGTAFLDRHSSLSRPPVVELRTTGGRPLAELSRADISRLEAAGYTAAEQFTVTAADGETELWGAMFKPHDFDLSKRYPVIEYVYGGPQTTIVPHGFVEGTPFAFGAIAAQALAQLGYVTVLLDARGTPGRSKAFHDASYLRFANVLADDHAETIRQLDDRYEFIDGTRVGIIGHSWGGNSAFRCLADRPDVYKAAVCSAPGFDPYSMIIYECYLDLPQRNPEGYAFASAFPLASKIEGALMLAVGICDHLVWTGTVKMSEALIRAGKLHEFVLLPESYHYYDSVHDAYFWRKVADFFSRHLGEGSTREHADPARRAEELFS